MLLRAVCLAGLMLLAGILAGCAGSGSTGAGTPMHDTQNRY